MHDVIIDDTKNSFVATSKMEQRQEKLKKVAHPQRKRIEKLSQYLIDWLEKALIIASLISLDFLIFIGSGSYDMFSMFTIFTPEVWYILGAILILSIVLIYFLSFLKLLQNLAVAAVTFYFVIIMLNQFAAFDKNTMLASLAATYISQDLGLLLTYVSHIVIAFIISALVFIFISFASKLNIFWMLSFLILCNLTVVFAQMIDNKEHQKFDVIKEEVINAQAKPGKKFIYIGLQGLSSYAYLDELSKSLPEKSPELADIKKTQDIMLGFYAKNEFSFYPQTYTKFDTASRNFAQILNTNSKKTEDEYILKNIYPESFWIFNRLNAKDTYLKESRLYDTFKKSKFNVNAYQSSGIELCKINNEMAVQRCVERNSAPIDFDDMKLSPFQKISVILAQWIESMGIFNDFSALHTIFRPFTNADTLPAIGTSYQNIGIKNSADILNIVAQDIDKANGNSAFIINIDLPQDTYIYDEFCQIKPLDQWMNKKDLPWVKSISANEKRKAYVQQVRCLYGKLQEFMEKVYKKNSPNDTVVFIQGLSGLNGLDAPKESPNFLDELMNKNFVDSAVKDPLKKAFQIKTESCSAPDILAQYLYRKKQCPEFDLNLEDNLKTKILNQLHTFSIAPDKISEAQKSFDNWYKEWQSKQNTKEVKKPTFQNGIKPHSANANMKNIEKKNEVENKQIQKAPSVAKPIKEGKEDAIQPLQMKTIDAKK